MTNLVSLVELSIDLSKSGLEMFFPHYGAGILEHMWDNDEITMESGMSSGKAWEYLAEIGVENPNTGRPISRASVIFFLNRLVDLNVLAYAEATGKGGVHRLYAPIRTRALFWSWVKEMTNKRLDDESPQ